MRKLIAVSSWVFCAAAVLCSLPLAAQVPPTVRFDADALIAEGLPPGGSVAFFGVGREMVDFLPHRLAVWEVVTADATGTARLELERSVPAASTWAAVEMGGGEITLAAPPGTALREISFPTDALPAVLNRLDDGRSELTVLWVRPAAEGEQAGAWGGAVSDGSARDDDGSQNRGLRVRLDLLEPLAASPPPPAAVAAGDVLVAIDPDSLEVYAARLVR